MTANSFHLEGTDPEACIGGVLFRASKANFPVLDGLSVQSLDLEPGGIREPHSHPNAAQLDYCIEGRARIGIIGPDQNVQLLDLEQGHISFVPQGYIHWIENIGEQNLRLLLVVSHEEAETIELSAILSGMPGDVLSKMPAAAH